MHGEAASASTTVGLDLQRGRLNVLLDFPLAF